MRSAVRDGSSQTQASPFRPENRSQVMTMIGCLDTIHDGVVRGWAFDDRTGTSPSVSIFVDGRIVGDVVGTDFRGDVLAAGHGDGRCGFAFRLPQLKTSPTLVRAAFAATGTTLLRGERVVAGDEIPLGDLFSGVLARGMWMPRAIGVDGAIRVEGWAVPPFGMPTEFAIAHGGKRLELVSRTPSSEASRRFGIPAGAGAYDFMAIGESDPSDTPTTVHEFTFVDPRTDRPFNPYHTIYFQREHDGPVPDIARRKRVGGDVDLGPFLLQGSTAYNRLDRVLHDYFGTSFASSSAILDWGCGCGRVFSHLPTSMLEHLTGIDIDADNVTWCRTAYPAARFETVALHPPTMLAPESFDVVFGISVLTHLLEPGAEAWLRELHRLTKPGAAVLVTILGEIAWTQTGLPLASFARFRSSGFHVASKNFDLDDAPIDSSEYYNTFVSRRYVYERWSAYFDVLDVIAGGIGNHQDLVVLRRRP